MIRLCSALVACLLLAGCGVQEPKTDGAPTPQGTTHTQEPQQNKPITEPLLTMDKEEYSLGDTSLGYTLTNETSAEQLIVMAPRLVRLEGEQWLPVECTAGFCGTPDTLTDTLQSSIETNWYPNLQPGTYRLGLRWVDEAYAEKQWLTSQFTLVE